MAEAGEGTDGSQFSLVKVPCLQGWGKSEVWYLIKPCEASPLGQQRECPWEQSKPSILWEGIGGGSSLDACPFWQCIGAMGYG